MLFDNSALDVTLFVPYATFPTKNEFKPDNEPALPSIVTDPNFVTAVIPTYSPSLLVRGKA